MKLERHVLLRSQKKKKNQLTGTLDWALPTSMEWLDLRHNLFDGSICLKALPERMEYLDVSETKFFGSLNLASLPDTLKKTLRFNADENKLSGSVDLTRLPAGLMNLSLYTNQLSEHLR